MEIHSVRIEHGPVQTPTMSYSQRQPPNHRPNHNQATQDIYKPSRSPLPPPTSSRYPYPTASPAQLPPQISNQQQRYVTSQQQQQQPTSVANVFPTAAVAAAAAAAAAGYREYRTTPRISLLHPHEYARGGNSRDMQQPVGMHMEGQQHHHHQQQPIKKIRLQEHKEVIQPLRIDTREQPGTYNPQVEAISPTLPDHLQQEEQTFRTTKDELIQQIGKVDREIAKAESQITILKKIEKDLEEIASKPSVKDEVDPEDAAQPLKHQSLPQKIYAENRKKAQSAHAKLDALGPKVEWPLYNQPSDTAIYHENKRKHMAFKKRLLEYFKRRHVEKDTRNGYLTETYSKLMQEWVRKVEKIENTTKRKAKEAKNREFFEKVFPELRKQREDKERFNRVGARVKSEADMEEIMDNLQEQAMEDKKMRSYAVIPPILLDAKERKLTYQDNNGYIDDMEHVYKSRQFLNIWTPSEKEIFKEKYLQHPKNFGVIASFIERKTVADCVQYYYLSKKTENYKQLLRKSRQRTRSSRNNSQKVTSANNASVVDILTTGVTTRLQREQQQQRTVGQQQQQQSSSSTSSSSSTRNDVVTTSTTSSSTTTDGGGGGGNYSSASNNQSLTTNNCLASGIVVTSSSGCNNNNNNNNNVSAPKSPQQQQQQKSSSSSDGSGANNNNNTSDTNNKCDFVNNVNVATTTSAVATPTIGSDEFKPKFFGDDSTNKLETTQAGGEQQQQQQHDLVEVKKEDINQDVSDQTSSSTSISENKKKKERRKDKENANVETSDDENLEIQDKSIQGICIVCNAQLGPHLQSRPLVPSQATQYGLHEDQIPANGRVCNTCRCKCVRSRYTHCPLPTCPNSRGRVKRLRSFPQRFQDLPNDLREPLLAEFHISSGITKCCSACFNRIQRRLGPPEEWSEDEVQQLKIALTDLGANWSAIGERLNKSAQQIRAFYSANRKRFNLEICLGDRKPTLTDEEESGSSTSSCEEAAAAAAAAAVQTQLLRNTNSAGSSSTTSSTGGGGNADRHSSDTASAAESPPNLAAVQQQTGNSCAIKKEDYDSSATETADEAQTTPDHYQGSATITPVTTDGQPKQNASPLSVKDLVLNVIEFQLMKNPGAQLQANATQPTTSGMAPTISSILNNDSNEVTIVSEYNLNSQQQQQQQQQQVRQRNDLNLAKLVTPLIGATITPVPAVTQPPPSSHHAIQQQQDDLVVLQVPETGSHQPETLDLSIKKPREMREMMPSHNKQQHRGGGEYLQHSYHERKSPAFSSIRPQPKLPSPKPANLKSGSITLGTPMLNQPRYEGLLRQMPADAKMGSITQGTPIHLPSQQQQQHMQEKRAYEFYKRSGGQSNQQNQQQQQNYQYRQPAYNVEQQIQSRQIIMNDYITSQQMISRRNEKSYYQANSPVHRTPPPNHQQQQNSALVANQQRQGVIQRHNTRPQYLPPGHEALSSLVDVAVQQPSLPVPPNAPHEGLGKTMADNIMEQPHRFQVLQQHQQQQIRQQQQQQQHVQQRLMEEHQRRIVYQQNSSVRQQQQHQQQQRNNSEGSTSLTAASLIDAIITHQINQTSEGGREMITNQREPRAGDLLFQSFHPPQQQQQQQQAQENNGEAAASSVISIDLDAEPAASSGTINKNLTVKELTDSVISHDFSTRQPSNYYLQQQEEQWKRRLKEDKRAGTPQQDERQIIRIAQSQQQQQQQQKFHVEPVSPPDNHWSDQQQQQQSFRRYPQSVPAAAAVAAQQQQQQNQHMSPLDYVKNRIVEVMRTEDDKKEDEGGKERSDSPGEMVIDEDKHEEQQQQQQRSGSVEQQGFGGYSFIQQHNDSTANDARNNEPKPLLSAQYEPLSDED